MKKVSLLVSVLLIGVLFVACGDKKKNVPTPSLTFKPASIEVKVTESATVTISGGMAPYTVKEADKTTATATIDKNSVKVTGVKEGQTVIAVTDSKGVKGAIAVKVTKKS